MERRNVFEPLERRQMLSAVPIGSKIKVAMLTDSNGAALNSSRLTVKFSEAITISDTSKIRIFGYGIDPTSGSGTAQQKITINVTNVEAGADGNKVVITTDRRVRKNAKLTFYNGFVKNTVDNTDTGDVATNLPKGLNKERYTLACRAFEPTNLKYFNKTQYDAATNVTATPTAPSENTVRAALVTHLDKKVTAGTITADEKTAALALFDDTTNKSTVPSANLRAAIVSLYGTVGESSIPHLLGTSNVTGKRYSVIDFSDSEVSASALVAETLINPTNGRLRTLYKSSFKGENFLALSANLAHEALHQDTGTIVVDGISEEIFCNTVETVVWAQQLMIDKAPADDHTQLVTNQNALLLAMLNSGKALYPRVGVYDAPLLGGQNVFNGGDAVAGGDYTSFENYVRRIYAARNFADSETPAPPLALTMQNEICARTDTNSFNYRSSRTDFWDNSQQIITDKSAVALAAVLKLQVQK
jgi:hypothetical protein